MRKFTTTALALAFCVPLAAQVPAGKKVINAEQKNRVVSYDQVREQMLSGETNLMQARQIQNAPATPQRSNRAQITVNPVELGRASNAFTCTRTEQNQVIAIDSLDMVGFIHRQDVTVFGGGSTNNGMFRYDLSTDAGGTFTNDVGPMQTLYTDYGRYPQMTAYNPAGNANPFNAKFLFNGPTNHFPTPGWVGHVYGMSDVSTSTVTTTEHYITNHNTLLPGGFCQGLPGEFWNVDWSFDGTDVMDSLQLFKGVWNAQTNDFDWSHNRTITLAFSVDNPLSGRAAIGPVVSFSPDGNTGWIAFLSDMDGGPSNLALSPVFIKSTDGGATWGAPVEVDMAASAPWIADSLQMLWVDSTGNPASDGIPTTSFDLDLIVDADGNPHLGTTIGTHGAGQAYSIASGLAMFMADVYSTDGGASFDVDYLAPVLSLRGEFGQPDANGALLTMDNNCQVSRSADGNHIFFAWVDSDTNTTGFSITDNLAPNLRIVGKRTTDGYMTCYRLITDNDLVWEGRALFPMISPEVLTSGSTYKLPIVMLDLIAGDQSQPVRFWYFGNDATLNEADFMPPGFYNRSWDGPCYGFITHTTPATPVNSVNLFQSVPNPSHGRASITFELPASMNVEMELVNLLGQKAGILASGNYAAGSHTVEVNTENLAAGVYMYTLRAGDQVLTQKMIVE